MRTALRTIILAIREAWNPRTALFGNGEVGVWYDPSDLTTMFQDSAGTTPVTAVEQPVGLILDKSKGLVLGAELVTNGDFSNGTTGWSVAGASQAVVSGELEVTVTAGGWYDYQNFTTVVGKTYIVTGTVRPAAGNSVAQSGRVYIETPTVGVVASVNGTAKQVSFVFTASTTSTRVNLGVASSGAVGAIGDKAYFDNISVRELPGAHAVQATAASRPTLSQRVNTVLSDILGGGWNRRSVDQTYTLQGYLWRSCPVWQLANFGADYVQITSAFGALPAKVYASFSFDVAPVSGSNWIGMMLYDGSVLASQWFNLSTKAFTARSGCVAFTNTSFVDLGDGTLRVTVKHDFSGSASSTQPQAYLYAGLTADGVSQTAGVACVVDVARFSLVPADQASLPYQRINTATDYATVGFPEIMNFDAVDDVHTTTFASSLGTDCTVARARAGTTPVILTGQTIGTSYAMSTDHSGLVIVNRALTAGETAALTTYLTAKGAS